MEAPPPPHAAFQSLDQMQTIKSDLVDDDDRHRLVAKLRHLFQRHHPGQHSPFPHSPRAFPSSPKGSPPYSSGPATQANTVSPLALPPTAANKGGTLHVPLRVGRVGAQPKQDGFVSPAKLGWSPYTSPATSPRHSHERHPAFPSPSHTGGMPTHVILLIAHYATGVPLTTEERRGKREALAELSGAMEGVMLPVEDEKSMVTEIPYGEEGGARTLLRSPFAEEEQDFEESSRLGEGDVVLSRKIDFGAKGEATAHKNKAT